MLRIDPAEPMLRIDPVEPKLKIDESAEPIGRDRRRVVPISGILAVQSGELSGDG